MIEGRFEIYIEGDIFDNESETFLDHYEVLSLLLCMDEHNKALRELLLTWSDLTKSDIENKLK